ncbi:discoidin domain-containing protein [Streptomyces sp. NPDC051976]|uniref:discoidin domain-containing protein n=1 Tax=Streptomyces sp. NPDC051976 TaxID=3154947 RepID=UPI003434E655
MTRRPSVRGVAALFAVVTAVLVALLTAQLGSSSSASAASNQQAFLTFYGWYDNTPPGGDISYPVLHDTAGGTGTYADAITFASSTAEVPKGKRIWVPRVGKYFILEDSCEECSADWSGHGPNGGPNLYHFDLWLGGQGGNAFNAIDCEDALTHYNDDNTPTLEPVIIDPPSNEPYDSTPIFNTKTGACYGGAQPNTTVGQYKNVSTGQCIDNPGNSTSTGTTLATKACDGSAEQTFTFHGAFLVSNNHCASMSGSAIKLAACDGGPNEQWSVNPNLTISDIQTGKKCFRATGSTLSAGSCSGAASQWNFTPAGGTPPTSPPPTTPPPTTPPPTTPPPGGDTLLSQGKTATASSVESSSYPASKAVDGNLTSTRWASKEGVDPQWISVDLGASDRISHVKLSWEAAYAKSYTVQTSDDGSTWTTIYSTTTGNGGTDDLTGLSGTGRYVRVNGTVRGTTYGYSLYELQVYGSTS